LVTRHMLFVGFSLTDDNFHRIADDVRKAFGDDRPGRFGTALVPRRRELMEEIWRDDVSFVELGEHPSQTRSLDLFLDRLVHQSSSASRYLLDPTYAGMLTSDESELAALLEPLTKASMSVQDLPAWRYVAELLTELGGAGRTAGNRNAR
jgi:hypothetical protein